MLTLWAYVRYAEVKSKKVKLKNEKPELKDYILNENPEEVFTDLVFIDEGCFGQVFKGVYVKTKQVVAIKTIRMQGINIYLKILYIYRNIDFIGIIWELL